MNNMINDQIAKRNVAVLILAQTILGAQMPVFFTIGGLAGQTIAPNPCLATLPITCTVLGSMLTARPLSQFMNTHGRRKGFGIGALGGFTGGLLGMIAMYMQSFALLCLGGLALGVYMSAQGFFRFAAIDRASEDFRPKAISYTMAGGLVAAIIGPQLVKSTADAFIIPFAATFLGIMALNFIGSFTILGLNLPKPKGVAAPKLSGAELRRVFKRPGIWVATICAMVSYALMNLVMTSTPIAVVGCGFAKADAANVVSLHVLAMFVPSFFTGHLIKRFGVNTIIAVGLIILLGAGIVALSGVTLTKFYIALILLGIGWNFGFVGGTALLAKNYSPREQASVQGMNDFIVFGGVTVASLSSGGLMNCSGGSVVAGWSAVNMAMVPFLMLAGASLFYLRYGAKEQPA